MLSRIVAIAIFALYTGTAYAGEIVLTAPVMVPAITRVRLDAWKMNSDSITVWYSERSDDNSIHSEKRVELDNECIRPAGPKTQSECEASYGIWKPWFSNINNVVVSTDDVGRGTVRIVEAKILQQLRLKLGVSGSISP